VYEQRSKDNLGVEAGKDNFTHCRAQARRWAKPIYGDTGSWDGTTTEMMGTAMVSLVGLKIVREDGNPMSGGRCSPLYNRILCRLNHG